MDKIYNKIKLLIPLLWLLSLTLNLTGINAGLPSMEQTQLVFPDKALFAKLTGVMNSLRDDVYAEYKNQSNVEFRKTFIPTNDIISIKINDGVLKVEAVKLHALRSALLQSRFPDEQHAMRSLANIKPALKQFNPHFFCYGGVYIYSIGFSIKLSEMLGLATITSSMEYYFYHPAEMAKLYVIPKIWGGIVTSLSIPLIFLCARRLFGLQTGIIAALFLAVIPSLPVESHSLKPYGFVLPFIILSLYFSTSILSSEKRRYYFLAGIFSGLAAGSLILAGIVILSPVAAHFMIGCGNRENRKPFFDFKILILASGFLLAFIITNPYFLLSFNEMRNEFAGLSSNEIKFNISLNHLYRHLFVEFPKEFGIPLYILVLIGVVFSIFRSRRQDWLILSVFLPFYAYLLCTFWYSSHYASPLIPLSIILAARFCVWLGSKLHWIIVYRAILIIVAGFTLGNSIFYDLIFLKNKQFLLSAGSWINANIPDNSSIGTSSYPYFGYGGFPPFALLKYRINEENSPSYFLISNDNDHRLSDSSFLNDYALVKEIERPKSFFDLIYKNKLAYFLDYKTRIYLLRHDIRS